MEVASLILAAGKGERMLSRLPKVLHPVAGRPMLFYPVNVSEKLGFKRKIVIVGHGKEEVSRRFEDNAVEFVEQGEQLGTAHAVLMTEEYLKEWDGCILILSGDVPLITNNIIKDLLNRHIHDSADLTIMTTKMDNPTGYGRVIRDKASRVLKIIEEAEANGEEKKIKEINAGIYCVNSRYLFDILKRIKPSKKKGEYYLTDMVELMAMEGYRISSYLYPNPMEVMGVNTRAGLAFANKVMRERIVNGLMASGVTFLDPATTYIDYGVDIGMDSTISPNVHIQGESRIGDECIIEENCKIKDSLLGKGCHIHTSTVIESSIIGDKAVIGPYARLRPGNRIANNVKIGNFVEVKNSTIGEGSKANHLSYIGDAQVGEKVNIGAGTITCNYDGFRKHQTMIEDGAFIGSNTQLVAPVRVGKGAYIGSGSTITKDVPSGALALSRVDQKNIEGWVERRMKRIRDQKR